MKFAARTGTSNEKTKEIMRFTFRLFIPAIILLLIASCGNSGSSIKGDKAAKSEKITQKEDGTIALNLEKASFYKSEADPSCNTAEWNIVVSKPGRYNVWLSTATKDTMNLNYAGSVKISLEDERIEAKPVGDKIILDSNDVQYPYFRADSYMGTFYIEEAGEYSLQLISEKVGISEAKAPAGQDPDNTKLMSVLLTPMTR